MTKLRCWGTSRNRKTHWEWLSITVVVDKQRNKAVVINVAFRTLGAVALKLREWLKQQKQHRDLCSDNYSPRKR